LTAWKKTVLRRLTVLKMLVALTTRLVALTTRLVVLTTRLVIFWFS
jgi:hypothetical protein